jgi:hypothetical protein
LIASNPLGEKSAQIDFAIQSAPEGLSLNSKQYIAALGNATHFTVSITAGVDVTFDWTMGDGTSYTNAGQLIN